MKSVNKETENVYTNVPVIDNEICTKCGECGYICEFNALAVLKKSVMVFNELCHACGGCKLVCPVNAIEFQPRQIGIIEKSMIDDLLFYSGTLNVSETMSPPIIKMLKKKIQDDRIQIIDSPPGTACPTVSAIDDVDLVLLVTESTPFGLNDLKLVVELVKSMNLPVGFIINKSSGNDHLIEEYAKDQNIEIICKIPEKRSYAECYSRGEILVEKFKELQEQFALVEAFMQRIQL